MSRVLSHTAVFRQQGVFAGWPANHGAWQWGDEFLVGFIRGKYERGGMHDVTGHLQKVQARSMDGGETWSVEVPNVDFEAEKSTSLPPDIDLKNSILRLCGFYDHGGEQCVRGGGVYTSENRGRSWSGPFELIGLDIFSGHLRCTTRTCCLDHLIFVSFADGRHWGSDNTACIVRHRDHFEFLAVVCDDNARAVMPAAAEIGDIIIVVVRRRGPPRIGGWIDAFASNDDGRSWAFLSHVADTGKNNGNPPALIAHDGKLFCCYGNRDDKAMFVSCSEDLGNTWKQMLMLRKGANEDIGYPRLFKRSDGALVCVYYWSDREGDPQRIEATAFAT